MKITMPKSKPKPIKIKSQKEKHQYNNKELADFFIKYIGDNYTKLFYHMKNQYYYKDKLIMTDEHYHQSMLNIYNRIEKVGMSKMTSFSMSAVSFENLFYIATRNDIMATSKRAGKIDKLKTVEERIDANYAYDQETHEEWKALHMSEEEFIYKIFQYVENNYNFFESSCFKFYFLTDFSFETMAEISGYSDSHLYNTVSKIKKDVQLKFDFLNKKERGKD